jgi:hypothetical protein
LGWCYCAQPSRLALNRPDVSFGAAKISLLEPISLRQDSRLDGGVFQVLQNATLGFHNDLLELFLGATDVFLIPGASTVDVGIDCDVVVWFVGHLTAADVASNARFDVVGDRIGVQRPHRAATGNRWAIVAVLWTIVPHHLGSVEHNISCTSFLGKVGVRPFVQRLQPLVLRAEGGGVKKLLSIREEPDKAEVSSLLWRDCR